MAKIALITGGSRGLGKSMALSLAAKERDVIITFVTSKEEALDVVKQIQFLGRKAAAIYLDLKDIKGISAFIKNLNYTLSEVFKTNKFDFLVNNAGMGATVPFEEVSENLFDEFMNVHFKAPYFLTQKCLPLMNDGGRIINISSGTTRFSNPGYSVYASMKGAMEVLTKYQAKELGKRKITSNIIAPGPIETDFNNAFVRSNPEVKANLGNLSPLGRVGEADDIGGVVSFLCSEEARWINGQRIEVSGGINV